MSKRSQVQLEREKMWLDALVHGGDNVASVLRDNPMLTALAAIAVNWGLYKLGFWDARPVIDYESVVVPEVGHWEYRPDPGETSGRNLGEPGVGGIGATPPGGDGTTNGGGGGGRPLGTPDTGLLPEVPEGVDPRTTGYGWNEAGGPEYLVPVDTEGGTVGLVTPAPGGVTRRPGLPGTGLLGGGTDYGGTSTNVPWGSIGIGYWGTL